MMIPILQRTLIIGLICLGPAALYGEEVQSLRDKSKAIAETSQAPEPLPWEPDRPPVPRNYIQQPPVIPHQIQGYVINLRQNRCLGCHDWKKSQRSGATKISLTHFRDRDGNDLGHIAPRRYFCNQCHVPQKATRPIVDNTFKPVDYLK